jgi:Phospholipase_D-nuclease N-terminal
MIGGIIGIFVLLFLAIIGLLAFVFWIWMIIDAVQNKGLTEGEKIAWVLVVVFLHCLGALLYFLIGHPKRDTPLASA